MKGIHLSQTIDETADAVLKLLITTCKKFAFVCYSKLDGWYSLSFIS